MSRSSKLLWVAFGTVFGVVLLLRALSVYTDFLWFNELGQMAVIKTVWASRVKLGLLVGVPFFAWLYANMWAGRRLRQTEVTVIGQRLLPDAERAAIEQHLDKILLAFALIGGLLAGLAATSQWQEWLKYVNGVPFGKTDPLLHQDIAFYVFRLPFLQYIWRTSFYATIVAFVAVTLIYLYNETIRVQGTRVQATVPARIHCLSLLALAFVLKGIGYRLAIYGMLAQPAGAVPGGPGYSAVNYRLPVFTVQIIACMIAALVCLVTIRLRNLRVPAFALGGLMLLALLGGFSYPAIMEHWQVRPNALKLEPKYIAYNIEATKAAYGLDKIADRPHPIVPTLSREDVSGDKSTIQNIRIWDDRPLQYTYFQQQALRQYYQFARVDVDRYLVGGQPRQVSISARQISYDKVGNEWPNQHLQYTHGYGLCMSPVNMVDPEGWPEYWIRDFPPQAIGEARNEPSLKIAQAGLYYMEHVLVDPYGYGKLPPPSAAPQGPPGAPPQAGGAPAQPEAPPPGEERQQTRRNVNPLEERKIGDDYVIVRSGVDEIDYPLGTDKGDTAKNTYSGQGGVPVNSFLRRVAFTARFMDLPILFYHLGPESRILYNRLVPDRIKAVAPFLFPDPDAYPVIHEGRVVWMIDAYTVAARYPYATAVGGGSVPLAPNYIRNSIKATVDAFDGTTKLYVWDPTDPLIQTYRKIFPTLFLDKEQMPENLRRHVRYPRGLFEIQSIMFARYHVKDPVTFFQNEDAWAIPVETIADDERPVEPYYVLMSLPNQAQTEFLLMRPYTPVQREKLNMVAWVCARCDPEHYGELILYRFPKVELSYGPMQIEARISQNEWLANYFNWKSKANNIIRGHTLVIPIGNSLMYVEPIYLESKLNPVPKLSLVVVASSNKLGYGASLSDALESLFTGSGAPANLAVASGEEPGPAAATASGPPATAAGPAPTGTRWQLIQQLDNTYLEAEKARKAGDLSGYASKVQELGPIIERLKQGEGPTP